MTHTDRCIAAAQGYVELGLYDAARRVLRELELEHFARADVIELGLLCLMGERRWSDALIAANELCAAAPGEPGGYIHAAYCLHELDRTAEALELLQTGPRTLHTKPVYYYNLGCYNARLGLVDHALRFLERSFEMDKSLRRLAMKDPDLATIRSHLT